MSELHHHHHHQLCVASEGRSAILAPLPRRTALLHRSTGEQLESTRTKSSHLFLRWPGWRFQVLLERSPRDASMWQQTSWNVDGQTCGGQKLLCIGRRFAMALLMGQHQHGTVSLNTVVMCPSNTMSLRSPRTSIPNKTSIRSAAFVQRRCMTDWQDR